MSNSKQPSKCNTALEIAKDIELTDKHYFITGANSGIGFETARVLASRGATVTIACRDFVSACEAKDNILDEFENAIIHIELLDLADLESVASCADKFLESGKPLHGLILNAGVYNPVHRVTDAGFETTFQVNHLSHFYLTRLFTNRLIESAPSRVIVVASNAHRAQFRLNKLAWEKFSPTDKPKLNSAGQAYSLSMLAKMLFAAEFNSRYQQRGVTAYSLHPGTVRTNIARNSPAFSLYLNAIGRPFTKSVEQGAATSVYLATAEGIEEESGGYFINCRPSATSTLVQSEANREQIWTLSDEMLDWYLAGRERIEEEENEQAIAAAQRQ